MEYVPTPQRFPPPVGCISSLGVQRRRARLWRGSALLASLQRNYLLTLDDQYCANFRVVARSSGVTIGGHVLRIAAVFGTVGSVNLVVDCRIAFFNEDNVFLDAASPDASLVGDLRGAELGACTSAIGEHVKVIVDTHHPDGQRFAQLAIRSPRRNLQLLCATDFVEFFSSPYGHCFAPCDDGRSS